MGRLQGKTAFITGTANNQGRAAAILFAAERAFVVGCDVKTEEAEQTAELVRQAGGRMMSMAPVDLADPASAQRWIEAGLAEAGGIDILYNNAAAAKVALIAEMSAADWSYTMRNELDLVFHATKAAWPYLVGNGGGVIINTASAAGHRGSSTVGMVAHSTAKAGVIAFTRQIAAEGAPHRIRANSISPGPIESPGVFALDRSLDGRITASVPLGRLGRPEDVAYCALYLASDEASFITGSDIVVDGGATMIQPR